MKVLVVNNYYHPHVLGGAEKSTQILVEALAGAGAASLDPRGEASRGVVNGVPVHYLPAPTLGADQSNEKRTLAGRVTWHLAAALKPGQARPWAELLARERPDVVHTNNLAGVAMDIWKLSREAGAGVVHTLRGYYAMCPRGTMYKRGRNCERQCLECRAFTLTRRAASASVDVGVGNSACILDRHVTAGYFPQAERRVIFSAYETAAAPARPAPSARLRLGYIGRLHPTKGVEEMLDGLRLARETAWDLKIAGSGMTAYAEALKAGAKDLPADFVGWARAEEFYETIDVLIVPSRWAEPLPRTVYEAYAHGVPVIAAARGGIPEIVEEGRTGWLYDPDAPETLAEIVRAIAADPARLEPMRRAVLEKAGEFKPALSMAAYRTAYETAQERARGRS